VEEWEKRHGRIPEGAIVLLDGLGKPRWPDALRTGQPVMRRENAFPGFPWGAKLLIERKSGAGCGVATDEH